MPRAGAQPPRLLGQWIWTRRDVEVFQRERAQRPNLTPAVLVATVFEDLRFRHGLDPTLAGADAAVVVRFDPRVDRVWSQSDEHIATELDANLATLIAQVRGTGVGVREVQLDYDSPERRLPRWAHVVSRLARSSLAGIPLWVTSIPSHLRHDDYGLLFRGSIEGHILQLFDTGTPCSNDAAQALRGRLQRAELPFRLGVAAFERGREGQRSTEHGCWARTAPTLTHTPGFSGAWVFAASAPYDELALSLDALAQEPP
jgi:hypothetical protein